MCQPYHMFLCVNHITCYINVQGGEDSLLSAAAWEEDGQTSIRFIRKLSAGGDADHDMEGRMTLIWAHGQLTSFYKEDQLKYHGRSSRGINVLGTTNHPIFISHNDNDLLSYSRDPSLCKSVLPSD